MIDQLSNNVIAHPFYALYIAALIGVALTGLRNNNNN